MQQNINEINGENEKTLFHLFKVDINVFWNYFMDASFPITFFYDNCKLTNIKNLNKTLKENDVLDVFYKDKNLSVKLLIANIIDTPNFKSITFKLIEHPDDISTFTAVDSFYYCSYTNVTWLSIKIFVIFIIFIVLIQMLQGWVLKYSSLLKKKIKKILY